MDVRWNDELNMITETLSFKHIEAWTMTAILKTFEIHIHKLIYLF